MRFRTSAHVLGLTLSLTAACSGSLDDLATTSARAGDPAALTREEPTVRQASPATAVGPTTSPRVTASGDETVAANATSTLPGTAPPKVPTTAVKTPTGPTDPMAVYRGYLGTLEPADIVAPLPDFRPATVEGQLPFLGLPGVPASAQPVFVKIDNSGRAVPQSGLNDADIVIEEEVEWGITRLAAVFHSRDAIVGPVRSGRTTDLNFLPALGQPAFVYSGANKVTDILLRRLAAVDNVSAARNGNYWRQSGRRAPSNLFTDTAAFRSLEVTPPAFLHYRDPSIPADGQALSNLTIEFGSTTAGWDWDGAGWVRTQNGKAHLTSGGARVSAHSVVVLWVTSIDTGMVDSAGGVVPELILLGTGPAAVLIDGRRVDGEWAKPSLDSPLTIVDAAGAPLGVTPGRTWIELVTTEDLVR